MAATNMDRMDSTSSSDPTAQPTHPPASPILNTPPGPGLLPPLAGGTPPPLLTSSSMGGPPLISPPPLPPPPPPHLPHPPVSHPLATPPPVVSDGTPSSLLGRPHDAHIQVSAAEASPGARVQPGAPPLTPPISGSSASSAATPSISSGGVVTITTASPLFSLPPTMSPVSSGSSMPPAPAQGRGTEQEEVWLEHRTADGKVYYSHPHTHKTVWERPAGVKIIPPQPTLVGTPRPLALAPFPSPGHIPVLPVGVPVVPQRVWSEHNMGGPDGKVYFFNKITQQSVWEKPKDFDLVVPMPVGGRPGVPVSIGMSPAPVPIPVPLPVPGTTSGGMNAAVGTTGETANTNEKDGSGESGDGDSGHSNISGKESSDNSSSGGGGDTGGGDTGGGDGGSGTGGGSFSEGDKSAGLLPTPGGPPLPHPPQLAASLAAVLPQLQPKLLPMAQSIAGIMGQGAKLPVIEEPKKEEPKGPRPVQSVAVPGTPWSVVFTSHEKMFFFNATSKKSVWKIPQELAGNSFLKKVVPPWEKRVGEPAAKKPRLQEEEEEEEEEQKMEIEMATEEKKAVPHDKENDHVLSEAYAEAEKEQKAATLRAEKSLEERQADFKKMLLEREVSAFSTWEKELPKFVFDPRYLLLLARERKTAFEEFIRDRAEEERREKKNRLKEQREQFIKMLEESRINHRMTFSEFARLHGKDERFKAIEKKREREAIFSEYVTDLKKSSRERDGQHKESTRSRTDKLKADFFAMLAEDKETVREASEWRKVKGKFHHDDRYRAVDSSSQREELFKEYVKSLGRDERQERIQASLREREREVAISRTAHEKEWGKERDQFRKTEAQEVFKALLVDMVRKPDCSWSDTKKNLRKDHRWDLADLLDSTEKEKLFRNHVHVLTEKKRLQFRKLLDETSQITLTMSWKKAKKLIKEDARYKAFSDDDHQRREEEYERFQRDKMVQAKNEFKALLKETKKIDYMTQSKIKKSDKHLKEIMKVLENDQRYLVLECVAEERNRMLMIYIDDLRIKGPPPPPTASNPSDRVRK